MPLEPRFRRVPAARRPFVNRQGAFTAFREELAQFTAGPRVLSLTGIGGIGKSRLLRELDELARSNQPSHRTALLDLQVPTLREQHGALAALRLQLGAQGVRFDRYDLAYATLWQRLHPNLRLSARDLPLVGESELLGAIVDTAADIPVFATGVGLVRLLERARSGARRWRRLRSDPTLSSLDELSNAELIDAVTFLFAEDLAVAQDRPCVLFVDAYEAITGQAAPRTPGRADAWLRDLVVQFRGLTVVASRESLPWARFDPDWTAAIHAYPLDDLPYGERLRLLEGSGVDDPSAREAIARASQGVPFYLNLAADTWQRDRRVVGAVSPGELLARFLEHVEHSEARTLELLAVARTFDRALFRAVADAYDLPAHQLAWEGLTGYSFVAPAGPGHFQLHQLMAAALRDQLSAAAAAEVHRLLHRFWDERSGTTALREAAFHALRAGELTGPALLDYADRLAAQGGTHAVAGLRSDVSDIQAASPPPPELAEAARCLEAEAAIMLGDARTAAELAPESPPSTGAVAVRLALAGAHARRILGETMAAQTEYVRIWEATGHPVAGLWAADLHMAQGRFADAIELAGRIRAEATEPELAGDAARLLSLAHRFAFDFAGAARHLRDAEQAYAEAGTVIGQANVLVNQAELLAWTAPERALTVAATAVETQRELGAMHELGKAYTAMAVAHLMVGELDAADAALSCACDALDRARYRSGRARAEFYRAVLNGRRGDRDGLARAAAWAVAELEAAEVYPTLMIAADRLLTAYGRRDPAVEAAARRAGAAIRPWDGTGALGRRLERWVSVLAGTGGVAPEELYAQAREQSSLAGFYNTNVALETPAGRVIVRAPIHGADRMDLRIWPEAAVLRAIAAYVPDAPVVLHAESRFQIHEYVDGELLDEVAPRWIPVPEHVPGDVVTLFAGLAAVPPTSLPEVPEGWPEEGDSAAFARCLSAVTAGVHAEFGTEYAELFAALKVPADPLAPVLEAWASLTPRPFRLVHADVHRKNILIRAGRAVFLDWELALLGDPVYDLAVHLHKMGYLPEEERRTVAGWAEALPAELTAEWERDVRTYLRHERVKSTIVDSVRYAKLFAAGVLSPSQRPSYVQRLVTKVNLARDVWEIDGRVDEDGVARILERWAADHRTG